MSIFSKASGLQPAILLQMSSYIGFYQGSLNWTCYRKSLLVYSPLTPLSPEEEVELAQLSSLSDKLKASKSRQIRLFFVPERSLLFFCFFLVCVLQFFALYQNSTTFSTCSFWYSCNARPITFTHSSVNTKKKKGLDKTRFSRKLCLSVAIHCLVFRKFYLLFNYGEIEN